MRIKPNLLKTMLLVAAAISAVVFGLYTYNRTLQQDLTKSVYETLAEITQQQKFNFTSKIEADISAIKNLAFMASSVSRNIDEATETLSSLVKNSNFEFLSISNLDGDALVSNKTVLDISDEEYFIGAAKGETAIYNPQKSSIRDAVVVPISTPIYTNGKLTGVLSGSYTAEKLMDLFLPSFGGNGFVYVTDVDGNILVQPRNQHALLVNKYSQKNLYNGLSMAKSLEGHETTQQIRDNLANGKSSSTKISIGGSNEFICYSPIGVNDWNIFAVVPESYIATSANKITAKAAVFAVIVTAIFILFLFYVLLMQRKGRSERELHTKQLERLAYYDDITGLPNLNKFKLEVKEVLEKNPRSRFVLAKLDVINFKMINELFGFDSGDKVVIAMAEQINRVRSEMKLDIGAVTRVNADEFMLMDLFDSDVDELITRIELFEDIFNKHMHSLLGNHRVEFRYSVYFLDPGETDVVAAIEKTNIAHHIAKSQKNSRICFYDDLFKQRIMRETEIENQMNSALESRAYEVYLQPKYDLSGENVVGAEALVRWRTADGRMILPNEFIPLFERNGFIVKLDFYMFERACELIRGWIDDKKPVVTVSVNFSRAHLENSCFVKQLEEIANRYDVPKKHLEIELTESTIMDNEEMLEELLNNLHSIGFSLSMDDFGIGYSSLGLLKNLPVDVVKIDRSFFVNNRYKSRAKIVIESVIGMAKRLKITTVAEGVESLDHINLLREVGCDVVQGFYYARPMPASEFHDQSRRFISHDVKPDDSLFDVNLLGDINKGRDSLGDEMPVSVYRLFQFTIRDVLNRTYGEGEALEVFRTSGEMAGRTFAKLHLDLDAAFDDFILQLTQSLQSSKIGVLEIEEIDTITNTMTIVVRDDLDCSGTPNLAKTLCQYDEGFIAGILFEYTKKSYTVHEIDCWGTGADVCRFHVKQK